MSLAISPSFILSTLVSDLRALRVSDLEGKPTHEVVDNLWKILSSNDISSAMDWVVRTENRTNGLNAELVGTSPYVSIWREGVAGQDIRNLHYGQRVVIGKVDNDQKHELLCDYRIGIAIYVGHEVREVWMGIREDSFCEILGYHVMTAENLPQNIPHALTAEEVYQQLNIPLLAYSVQTDRRTPIRHENHRPIQLTLGMQPPSNVTGEGIHSLFSPSDVLPLSLATIQIRCWYWIYNDMILWSYGKVFISIIK